MDLKVILDAVPEIVTQLLAFVIVFWVLKRFAFGPILKAIDDRRGKILDEFAAIERGKRDLEALEREYRKKLSEIEETARIKIQEAAGVGVALSRDIQDKARQDAQRMVERAKEEIEQDLKRARLSMRDEIVSISGLMTEKILNEKLNAQDHEKLVDRFIKEIGTLS